MKQETYNPSKSSSPVPCARRPRHEAGPSGTNRLPSACRASRRGWAARLCESPRTMRAAQRCRAASHAWVVHTVQAPEKIRLQTEAPARTGTRRQCRCSSLCASHSSSGVCWPARGLLRGHPFSSRSRPLDSCLKHFSARQLPTEELSLNQTICNHTGLVGMWSPMPKNAVPSPQSRALGVGASFWSVQVLDSVLHSCHDGDAA